MNTQVNPRNDTIASADQESLSVKDKIIEMICTNPDLPTLGASISNIVQLSSAEEDSADQLTSMILADVALTQKIIRLANSVTFRGASNQVVTNISRAIQLLGLDTIKSCALAMILVDGMPGKQTQYVKKELKFALTASLAARQMAKRSAFPNAEEVAIAALFKNMGRLLVAAFDHTLYKETMDLVKQRTHTQTQASLKVIGCSFDDLTEFALQTWHIPEFIISAMKLITAKRLTPPKNRQEWMRQVTEFSEISAQLICHSEESSESELNELILQRFGSSLNIDEAKFAELIAQITEEASAVSNQINLQLSAASSSTTSAESDSINRHGTTEESSASTPHHASGKPHDAADQLNSGVNTITTMTASKQYKINELILLVLKTLHSSLGFSFGTFCLKDAANSQYRARFSLGDYSEEHQRQFIFSESSPDIFSLSIKKNVDLSIADSRDDKVQHMLPSWHRTLFTHTRSFIILPLVVNDKPIGIYYLDRAQPAPEGISSEEMKIIKTLKNKVLTALLAH
ncbi:HDOD domain-containing protein [Nitrosomonas sp. JL21]|uniref:HDOD domain-containing protein n=1 Tax=Nitrosomonas sp. JL21 TaxID=153949 RepID=UPI0013707C21|nr:HDOD domain-containing protein [Nitrosomonas sp. JL21]MBL8496579.1 HDOD domain-containing protein [Nitrosomonas sp.]MXS79112.1 HDOD domain-containing protein [Nitrosomonas sp. JL21]